MQKSNQILTKTIAELKKKSIEEEKGIWKAIARYLEAPARQARVVNLAKISRYSKENDTIIVPGKVLGGGDLNHKLTIAAFRISEQAREKIQKQNGNIISFEELMQKNPKGTGIKIIG
ncbi:50S ribosomal protein L18e [Candidatus Woesearchaeota archaeon]|nr:50S ribosomal protein L18e [Candidatus Woesearchaeota archaeon]